MGMGMGGLPMGGGDDMSVDWMFRIPEGMSCPTAFQETRALAKAVRLSIHPPTYPPRQTAPHSNRLSSSIHSPTHPPTYSVGQMDAGEPPGQRQLRFPPPESGRVGG